MKEEEGTFFSVASRTLGREESEQLPARYEAAKANMKEESDDLSQPENGDVRRQHEDLASRLSVLRDHVNADIHKMGRASINDWNGLRPVVNRDVAALHEQLRHASPITRIPLPVDTTR